MVQRRPIFLVWLLLAVFACAPLLRAADNLADLRARAEKGDAAAQFNLGMMYRNGEGVAKDATLAVIWWRKAAEQGNASAQTSLGVMYRIGEGVAKDAVEAVKWVRKAAEQGDEAAQFNLGAMYAKGEGVAKDTTEAVKWFRKAAEQGDAAAQFDLGLMYRTGEGVAKDTTEAVKWFRKAAEQGGAEAQTRLGTTYYTGEGVAKDFAEAMKWYRKAAEQGNAVAQALIGFMFSFGEGVPKDEIEALAFFNLAASGGDENITEERDLVERRLGQNAALLAQQRSKELLKEFQTARNKMAAKNGSGADGNAASPKASGTGAIVSAQGHLLTAAHVVAGATSIKAMTSQGTKTAIVVRVDEANDLAVLKIGEGKFKPLAVAPSRPVKLGQTVATIGFPQVDLQGFSPKVTKGEISSLNGFADDPRGWQISVPVQAGNSGGPLLDESGNLVGVVVSKLGLKAAAATGDLPQNVNYAVKSAYALALLEPYLDSTAPEPSTATPKPKFEDMVAKAQESVVLILVY